MHRPKLKDKVYGEMFWEEWDEDESYWYAPIENEANDRFALLIRADSPTDFLAVGFTHSTYRRIIANIPNILDETVAEIMENSRELFKKKRQRNSAGEVIKKNLQIFSIKIYSDLSAEVEFVGRVAEDEDPDEVFYALLDTEGNLTEAGISEL